MNRITLLTDFGTSDGYVAAMKGIIAQFVPNALIDDVSHAIPPGDIIAGAFALRRYWKLYPVGTVHVVVVDPGVGSERRALIAEADGRFLVGPDNGVLGLVLKDAEHFRVFEIKATEPASRTFHGRDVFAPAAARIAAGASIDTLGHAITDPVWIILPPPIATESSVLGEVVHVDHFGNLISNIPADLVKSGHVAKIADREARIVGTYADGEAGELIALINSDRLLEFAVGNGNAAGALQLERGAVVELHAQPFGPVLM